MKNILEAGKLCLCLLFATVFFASCAQKISGGKSAASFYSMNDYSSVSKFDTHVHFNTYDATFLDQARADNFRLLTINVDTRYYPPIHQQREIGSRLAKNHAQQIAFATTFDVNNWQDKDWQQKTLHDLRNSFEQGAIAVKIWKNIGMELKDENGKMVMIDHPRFDTVFKYLEQNNIPVIGHLGEPRNCWLPVEQMTVLGDKRYFSSHPEYHMYLHPEMPRYEEQIAARDHILERYPGLKFIGAHLGSMEWSVDVLAGHLDKYPNLAVDMAARIPHFQYQAVQNWQKVRDFFIRYQDRLIYATDLQVDTSSQPVQRNRNAHERWMSNWEFFTSDHQMKIADVESEFKALHLPREVIDKIYRKNAERWIRGLGQGNR